MNSMQIKDKIRNISKEKNIEFNIILRSYMYERFIERLANSKYKDNFILKGGYFLSSIFGIDSRSTVDIDLCLKNKILSKSNIESIIKDINNVEINDGANVCIDDISDIKIEDEYGGYRVKLTVKIEKIRESFYIDIATGDLITPGEIVFKYKTIFDYKFLNLKSYNLETVLAEKLEIILSKKELSSRMKDYYDVYLITSIAKEKLDLDILRQAVNNTLKKRNFDENIRESFERIQNSEVLKIRWDAYARKNKYVR